MESFRTFQPVVTWIGGAVSGVGIEGFDGIEELLGEEPWFFHIHPWDYHNVEAATGFITQAGIDSVALLHEDSAFGGPGAAGAQALIEEEGLSVPLNEAFTSTLFGGTGDFRAAISKALATDPGMIYWIGYDSDVVPMIAQMRELNASPEYIFGAPPGWPAGFWRRSRSGSAWRGLSASCPTCPRPKRKPLPRPTARCTAKTPTTTWPRSPTRSSGPTPTPSTRRARRTRRR